eukprot:bmy_01256T0
MTRQVPKSIRATRRLGHSSSLQTQWKDLLLGRLPSLDLLPALAWFQIKLSGCPQRQVARRAAKTMQLHLQSFLAVHHSRSICVVSEQSAIPGFK